ncbi:MAG: type III pantothenate kinase [Gemmatimonadetes bacterium]|nr:type III pantothenate kinase [Gemmatimonadota bacterium]
MLLSLDVGNTEITGALFAGDEIRGHFRLTTVGPRTPDEWAATLTTHITLAGHSVREVKASAIASVAPAVTEDIAAGVEAATGRRPAVVGPGSILPLRLDVDEPLTVGADRVVNTLAAVELYKRDTIVVDFGTATTFDCITADTPPRFIGGAIAPGLVTGADNLVRLAAKLPATELSPPARAIGRRTEDCIRAGVLFGAADGADGMIRRIKAEWPTKSKPYVVATGGLAGRVAPLSKEIEHVEPHLTLIGIRLAAGHLGLRWL